MPLVLSFSDKQIQWIESQLACAIAQLSSISGGCIHQACRILLKDGREVFAKTHFSSQKVDGLSMFVAEAKGLEQMAREVPDSVPRILAVTDDLLLLEFLAEQPKTELFWEALAGQLVQLHLRTFERFGLDHDNFCGATLQPNTWSTNGHAFFAEQRLLYQGIMAFDNKRLSRKHLKDIEQLCVRLPELIPEQPAVLIHGDLWSGNCLNTFSGPKLIDPACYYGWAEADIAMTQLFGGFDQHFYTAYHAMIPPLKGWQERVALYNLYHLLNHLNLFGGSYLSSVQQVITRYC